VESKKPLGFLRHGKQLTHGTAPLKKKNRSSTGKWRTSSAVLGEKGVKMHGVYDCCWSTEWKYFTFWEVPNLELLEEVMEELSEIGDINMYNAQRHFVGRKVRD